jgi:glycosyltransferase involved in cell wall biosynthesis
MKIDNKVAADWPEGPPRDAWHSFDTTPWLHPWLTQRNLRTMRQLSAIWREEARRVVERADRMPSRFAFVGNMANGMYTRAKAVVRPGAEIEVFCLAGDESVFSDARWEEFDGTLPANASYLRGDQSFLADVQPRLPYHQLTQIADWATMREGNLPAYARLQDFRRWPYFFCDAPALERMQSFDAILAAQRPHIAYLSGRPYVFTQTGGDIWFEASRDDLLGRLMRAAFASASCIWVSNPWTYAHARRYGLSNLLYLPLVLNEDNYSPGPATAREQWKAQIGGDFFVLSSARADDIYKGSRIGLMGFAEFARRAPRARLIFTAWGVNLDRIRTEISRLGIADRVLLVPLAGKRKLVNYLRSADCLLDQFNLGYFGATGLEACACGLPVIIRLEAAQYAAFCETGAPPFLNAATSTEVANALEALASNPDQRAQLAADHRTWFLANQSGNRWADDYHAVLGAVALGHKFSFERSPLVEELSPAERLYHAEQLTAAPPFPNYDQPASYVDANRRLTEQIKEQSRAIEATQAELATLRSERDAMSEKLTEVAATLAGREVELARITRSILWRTRRLMQAIAHRALG